ncbi:hypothetical protein AQI88_38890 [Streptomyces cellostaticus]|uniref:Uncharacterized protein n=1 Tax=Streptomyces cellostaticus TaxID=67285 RepID=A0A101NBW6_9ACTN|nr:hypothetical protein AQI88_38890 [Streptomyces cellostaticus]
MHGDAGQDVGLVLVAAQLAQRGVVPLPVGWPLGVPVLVDRLQRGLPLGVVVKGAGAAPQLA